MLAARRLVIDTMSEVYDLLKPFADEEFWDFSTVLTQVGSIYVLGRQQLLENIERLKQMCNDGDCVMVFAGSAEGSNTHREQCARVLNIGDIIEQGRLLLITGGDMEPNWPYLLHEHFLCRILDFESNLIEMQRISEIYKKNYKPYDFLFLNGRARPHRKYLLEKFKLNGLLERSLWTMIDGRSNGSRYFQLHHDDVDLMRLSRPIRVLPSNYEVDRYSKNTIKAPEYQHQYPKFDLFNNEWGEIYLKADAYIDTYFSVVTETVFEYPYSFRTEKIAKPLTMGHPWICAANKGFYKDIRNLGFRTFDCLIDESFDDIDNHQDRMDRICKVVEDLCKQDLPAFLQSAEKICKYNQQHILDFTSQHRAGFARKFESFIESHA